MQSNHEKKTHIRAYEEHPQSYNSTRRATLDISKENTKQFTRVYTGVCGHNSRALYQQSVLTVEVNYLALLAWGWVGKAIHGALTSYGEMSTYRA